MTEPPTPDRLQVADDEDGLRLDQFLARRLPALGRRGAARLIADGGVTLEPGTRPTKASVLRAGDRVLVIWTPERLRQARPTEAPPLPCQLPDVRILESDDALVVLLKPAGRASHPLGPDEADTVANHLAWADPQCWQSGGPPREGGLCHRLDTLTSGLLVAARTETAYTHLRAAFARHEVEKGYLALVQGAPPEQGAVDAPIASERGRRRVRVGTGQPAKTQFVVRDRFADAALVEITTRHGRRHQVRAHLAHAGHPLVADVLYGGASVEGWTDGPLLHAHRIVLPHPSDNVLVTYEAAMPSDRRRRLDRLPR